MSNDTEDPAMKEDCEETETFPIYVLSFIYSILAAVIIAHLLFRWHLRRRKLSRFCSFQPLDKSFKSKVMRDILRRDFDFIKSLSPDPRLANKDHTPQEFGECAEGCEVPVHWYRMLAFDAAADFVSAHTTKAHPPPTLTPSHPTPPPSHPHKPTVSLPEFISTLDLPNHAQLLHNLSETYKLARYRDGEFGEGKLQLFQEGLQQLNEILKPDVAETPPSLPSLSSPIHPAARFRRQSTFTYSSQDPLLRMSSAEVATPTEAGSSPTKWPHLSRQETESETIPVVTAAIKASPQQHGTPINLKKRGTPSKLRYSGSLDSESSPLVTMQISPASLPRSPIESQFEESSNKQATSEPWQQPSSTDLETQV